MGILFESLVDLSNFLFKFSHHRHALRDTVGILLQTLLLRHWPGVTVELGGEDETVHRCMPTAVRGSSVLNVCSINCWLGVGKNVVFLLRTPATAER